MSRQRLEHTRSTGTGSVADSADSAASDDSLADALSTARRSIARSSSRDLEPEPELACDLDGALRPQLVQLELIDAAGDPPAVGPGTALGDWLLPSACFSPLPVSLVSSASAGARSARARGASSSLAAGSASAAAAVKLVSGQEVQLSERYVLLEQLGSGVSSEVFRAKDKSNGKHVAVKSLGKRWAGGGGGTKARQRAEREIAVLRRCGEAEIDGGGATGHPHIIQLLACVETDQKLHFVTPLCDGGDLLDLLSRHGGRLSEGEIVQLMKILCETVLWLHTEVKVVHRDIKPE